MSATATGSEPELPGSKQQQPQPQKQQNAKKGKKRKRPRQGSSPEELHRAESADRYGKLHHACSKHLHREAKVVKSFECQKVVRAIKSARDALDGKEGDGGAKSARATKRIEALEQKLELTKKMDLDVLVRVGLRRLGVLSLDPALDDGGDDDANESKKSRAEAGASSSQADEPFYKSLLETMMQHKRLSTSLDQLNEKVTEYQQWVMRRQAVLRGEDVGEDNTGAGGKKKKKKKNQQGKASSANDTLVVAGGYSSKKRGLDLGGHEGASGLFIGSLSGMAAGYDDDVGGEGYGDEDDDDYDQEEETAAKKNRPGQRARRAKAMAIEARKAGRTWDSSVNWREKKKGRDDDDHDGGAKNDGRGRRSKERDGRGGGDKRGGGRGNNERGGDEAKPKAKDAKHIAEMGKTWKEEGNAHPSWAAAQNQKSQGIAKFEGKKITFD